MDQHDFDRRLRGRLDGLSADRRPFAPDEHWHFVRLHNCLCCGIDYAPEEPRCRTTISMSDGPTDSNPWHWHVPSLDAVVARGQLVATDCVVGARHDYLLRLWKKA